MSEQNQVDNQLEGVNPVIDELAHLKAKAKKMGIPVKGNPSIETLRTAINEKLATTGGNEGKEEATEGTLTRSQRYAKVKREALALVRVQITCMNPDKRNLKGGIYSVGNKAIGTIKKYIPFNPASHPNGYHIPRALMEELRRRQYLVISSNENDKGHVVNSKTLVNEFNIVELPALSEEELKSLAKMQAAKAGL